MNFIGHVQPSPSQFGAANFLQPVRHIRHYLGGVNIAELDFRLFFCLIILFRINYKIFDAFLKMGSPAVR